MKWEKTQERKVSMEDKTFINRTYILPSGVKKTFPIEDSHDSAGILPITLDNKVLCVRQFRPGTEQVYDDLPGGRIEPGEYPLAAAERELLEETGYTGDFYRVVKTPRSAYRTNFFYCFVALNCKKIKDPSPDDHEFIEVIQKSKEEFEQQLMSGNLTNALVGLYGLQFLNRRK